MIFTALNTKFKTMLNSIKKALNKKSVAVISIQGPIGITSAMKSGVCFHALNKKIEEAFKVKNLKAIVINVNSPGGSPVQAELIHNRLRKLGEENNIPLIAFAEDLAASAGYYILCAGDEIYAARNSLIGSLGVISSGFGFDKVIKKAGVERRIYSQGKNKSILDPFQAEKKEDVAILLTAQKEVYENFKTLVNERRHGKLKNDSTIFTGSFWAAGKAKELGLIDDIGYLHDVITEKFGKDIHIKYISADKSWISRRLGINLFEQIQDLLHSAIDYLEYKLKFSYKLY
jgi:signal peptide peptidase SppA